MDRHRLRFFDFTVEVRTDVREVDEVCKNLFAQFLHTESRPDSVLELRSDGAGRFLVCDGTLDVIVEHREWLPDIAVARLLETAGNEARSHDLFHAAALSRRGVGVAIFGESGYGKSTLTLSLLRRDWRFLSDEVAALEIDGGLLVPFPKGIEIRPAALTMLGLPLPQTGRRGSKSIFDAEELVPGCLSRPCPPAAFVFLEAPEKAAPNKIGNLLRLTVHRRLEAICSELLKLEGVTSAAWNGEDHGWPVLEIHGDPLRFQAWRLDGVLGRRGMVIMSSSSTSRPPASFDQQPRLTQMRHEEGVLMLLRSFRGRRALAQRTGSSGEGLAELVASYMKRLRQARFFRLQVGHLQGMLELVEETLA